VANWVTFTPDGQIYIANSGLRSVTAINMATKKISAVVPVGESAEADQTRSLCAERYGLRRLLKNRAGVKRRPIA